MLDKIHPQLSQPTGDDNAYSTLEEISGHNINIVVTCLPSGVYGIILGDVLTLDSRRDPLCLEELL